MKQTLIFLIAWLAATALSAQQSTISGIVSIQNSEFDTGKRQYVTNVQVEDDFQKANAQLTDAQGAFKLIFVGVPEKTTVNLVVKKEGLEVVNIDGLGAVTGQRDQVRLSMAAPNKIAEYRRQIYNIGKTEAEKNLTALLQKKGKAIEALQKNATANAAKIQTLQTEYAALSEQSKKIEEQAEELARKYAPINLDDASPLYQDAFRAFQKGELDQALKILQQANLAQQAEKILKERQGIATIRREADQRDSVQQQRTTDVIAALQFKADLHKNRFEFDSTATCYEIMLQLDSTNTLTLGNYAYFLDFQNQDQQAILLYQQALFFAKTDEGKATFLNNLGNLYSTNQQMPQAESAYQEALQIRRQLATKNPNAFLPDVAATLNNLGDYYRINNKMPQAESAYQEALQIRRQLAAKNPDTFLPDVAGTLNNLGIYYLTNQQMPQAERAYQEALQISRQLAAKNPDAFLPDVAQTLNNLGNYYLTNKQMPQADSAYQKVLQIYRQLAAKNPDAFLPNVAGTLNNLGIYYRNNQQMLQAESAYQEALQIRRQLAAQNPAAFLPDVAGTLNNLGIYYYTNQQMPQAESAYQEALQIRRQLAAKNPDAFLPDVAGTLNNLGNYYRDNQQMPQAESAYQEALQISRQLAAKNPDAFLSYLATTLHNLGNYYLTNKQMPQADSAYQEALQIRRQLAAKNPDAFLPDVAGTLNNLGIYYLTNQQMPQAERAYQEALQISRQLAAKNPDAFLPDVAQTLNNLGNYYKTLQQYDQALQQYQEAITIREKAILGGGSHFFQEWVKVLSNISEVKDSVQAKKDFINVAKAGYLLAESCDHLKSVNEKLLPAAIYQYGSLSWDALFIKDFALAEKAALRCLALDREQEWVLTNLGHSYLLRGQYSQAQTTYEKLKGKKDDAGKAYKQVLLDDFLALEEAGITHSDMAKMKAWIAGW